MKQAYWRAATLSIYEAGRRQWDAELMLMFSAKQNQVFVICTPRTMVQYSVTDITVTIHKYFSDMRVSLSFAKKVV